LQARQPSSVAGAAAAAAVTWPASAFWAGFFEQPVIAKARLHMTIARTAGLRFMLSV
jgi:hypothetical protein